MAGVIELGTDLGSGRDGDGGSGKLRSAVENGRPKERRTFAFSVTLDERKASREVKQHKNMERERKRQEAKRRLKQESATRPREGVVGGAGRGHGSHGDGNNPEGRSGGGTSSTGGRQEEDILDKTKKRIVVQVQGKQNTKDIVARNANCGPMRWLERENPEGNVEYKLKLVGVSTSRLEHLVTQLKFRFSESTGSQEGQRGTCRYYLGVEDDGFCRGLPAGELRETIETLVTMVAALTGAVPTEEEAAETRAFLERVCCSGKSRRPEEDYLCDPHVCGGGQHFSMRLRICKGYAGDFAECHLRLIPKRHACSYKELRVVMCGAHQAGKSTLMSVLTHGEDEKPLLCNGMGQARSRVFTHKHEVESGRTSSIAHESLAYGRNGHCLNYQTSSACWPLTPLEMSREAGKMLRLFDLSGHERYLKTTCYGLTCLVPDFVMLIVSAQEGVSEMTREHAKLARLLGAPIFVVVTKIDLCPNDNEILEAVLPVLGNACRPVRARTARQARELGKRLGKCEISGEGGNHGAVVPVLGLSCVTGEGVDLLHEFLKKLRPTGGRRQSHGSKSEMSAERGSDLLHFQVHRTFEVPSVGLVLFGTVLSGKIKVGGRLLLGPNEEGGFVPVTVRSIQRSQVAVGKLVAGQTGTLAVAGGPGDADPLGDDRHSISLEPPAKSPSIAIPSKKGDAAGYCGSPSSPTFAPGSPLGGSPPAKKGTVLIRGLTPSAHRTFRAFVRCTEEGAFPVYKGGVVVVHCGSIMQAAAIASVAEVEEGDSSWPLLPPEESDALPLLVGFKFLHRAEWMSSGSRLVLRSQQTGRLGGVGVVH